MSLDTPALSADERRRLIGILAATPASLKERLKGVPRRLQLWSPAPGKWSMLEIVCHLRDMEREAYLERYRRILGEDEPVLPDIDGDRCAMERDYRSQRLSEALREWQGLRRECLKLLRSVRGEAWRRRGIHESAGPLTLDDLLRRHALGNDEAHLSQLQAIPPRHALLERLAAGPKALREAVRGLSNEQARRRPDPQRWSVVEIACHLRDVESLYAERITKIAHAERAELWVMEPERVAGSRRYRDADIAAAVKEFARLRDDTVILLRALPHPAWQRVGRHPERGLLSIAAIADHLGAHEASHLRRIGEIRAGL
jgi:hypothetical protein